MSVIAPEGCANCGHFRTAHQPLGYCRHCDCTAFAVEVPTAPEATEPAGESVRGVQESEREAFMRALWDKAHEMGRDEFAKQWRDAAVSDPDICACGHHQGSHYAGPDAVACDGVGCGCPVFSPRRPERSRP